MDISIYGTYAEVNEEFGLPRDGCEALDEDTHVEQLAFVIAIYKYSDSGFEGEPSLPYLGASFAQHIRVGDKWDLFIYERD